MIFFMDEKPPHIRVVPDAGETPPVLRRKPKRKPPKPKPVDPVVLDAEGNEIDFEFGRGEPMFVEGSPYRKFLVNHCAIYGFSPSGMKKAFIKEFGDQVILPSRLETRIHTLLYTNDKFKNEVYAKQKDDTVNLTEAIPYANSMNRMRLISDRIQRAARDEDMQLMRGLMKDMREEVSLLVNKGSNGNGAQAIIEALAQISGKGRGAVEANPETAGEILSNEFISAVFGGDPANPALLPAGSAQRASVLASRRAATLIADPDAVDAAGGTAAPPEDPGDELD